MCGDVERKVLAFSAIVYNVAKERFGINAPKKQKQGTKQPNRRQRQIEECRQCLRQLRKRYMSATEGEKLGLQHLREIQRDRLINLRKAEGFRRRRKARDRTRAAFTSNPYRFSKTLLGGEKSGRLECSKEDIEQYLAEVHSDPRREEQLGVSPRICPEDPPTLLLDMKEPTWREIQEVVRKARS